MSTKMKNNVSRSIARVGAICAISALLAMPASVMAQDEGTVEVSDYDTVTLTVKDTDLASVLEMLSIQSKKNIITSKNVSATVTANLYDVTFEEALNAILGVNGFVYEIQGNFIFVYTQAEWEDIEQSRRKSESRIFQLEYLSATDANEFIAPLLSENGQSSYRGDVERGYMPDISLGGEDSYAYEAKLIVNDYTENLELIARLLTDLDTPPTQVLVEATILQTVLDEANAFGVDFTVLGSLDFTDLAAPLTAVNGLLDGTIGPIAVQPEDNNGKAVTSTVGNTRGAGGLKVGILDDDIAVFLRVLDEVTDTTVLSRPKVMCLNRQRAEVLVGARVGYLSTTATETTTTQTVEFLDTGVQLVFRPFISRSGMVRLELSPSVSEASLRTVTDSQGIQVTIPDELTNELTTNVRIRDGQTLVLGGLFRESTRVSRRQVPVIGDIPILGAAFRGQDDSVDRDEIIFLITPTIIDDSALWEAGQETEDFAEAARVGARRGLLPFSRERMTASYNKDAIAAFNQGDTEKALYYVNNSLRLKTVQPEMIRFREKLTGARETAHENSVMQRVFNNDMIDELNRMSIMSPGNMPGNAPAFHVAPPLNTDPAAWGISDGTQSQPATDDLSMNGFGMTYDDFYMPTDSATEADVEATSQIMSFWGMPFVAGSEAQATEATASVPLD